MPQRKAADTIMEQTGHDAPQADTALEASMAPNLRTAAMEHIKDWHSRILKLFSDSSSKCD
jgi:hypothetical protein